MATYLPDVDGLPAWDVIEELGVGLAARYAGAEDELIKAIAVRAYRDLELQEIIRTTTMDAELSAMFTSAVARNRALAELQAHRATTLRELQARAVLIVEKLRTVEAAEEVIATAWKEGEAAAAARLGAASRLPQTSALTGVDSQAATMLSLDLSSRLELMEQRIVRFPQDAYQSIISFTASNTILGASTNLQAQQLAVQHFLAEGVRGFVDKGGRNWKIGSYAEMAGRTAVNRAFNDAGVYRMQQSGLNLITPVAAADCCAECSRYRGQILSTDGSTGTVVVQHATLPEQITIQIFATLDQAKRNGLGHPNDRCQYVAYSPGLSIPQAGTEFDPDAAAARVRQRALEVQIRSAKRQLAVARGPEQTKRANARVRQRQAAMRDHIEATDRPRRSYREQLSFADGRS